MSTRGPPPTVWYNPATWYAFLSFSWVEELINKAVRDGDLSQQDAYSILPPKDDADALSAEFEKAYAAVKAKHGDVPSTAVLNHATRTLLCLYKGKLFVHALWTCTEVAIRLASPVALRAFLVWLLDYHNGKNPSTGKGWGLAVALGASGLGMAIFHHRLFWVGMKAGMTMRQQVVAAVSAKALRLNAAAVSHISQGHVVNLVSNDVRRFDDAMPYWVFLWAGPLELGMVLLMVSLELGFLPALAGVGATLALIPLQVSLVKPVAGIRKATAQFTDERVRLAGEVVQGSLAMKMLSWELPFCKALSDIRAKEARHIRQMARIRAANFALQFAMDPVISFAAYAVYRAIHGQLMSVASVFYALSLLHLPKLYMVQFFVMGMQSFTELRVSLIRIDKFLSSEEPPLPHHTPAADVANSTTESATAAVVTPEIASGTAAAAAAATGVIEGGDDNVNSVLPVTEIATAAATTAQDGIVLTCMEDSMGYMPAVELDARLDTIMESVWSENKQSSRQPHTGSSLRQRTPSTARHTSEVVLVLTEHDEIPTPAESHRYPAGFLALRGADYDWKQPLGHKTSDPTPASSPKHASKPAENRQKNDNESDPASSNESLGNNNSSESNVTSMSKANLGPTLQQVEFELQPGQLLGICGEVGCGKSSVLAALLGELQPLPEQDTAAARPGKHAVQSSELQEIVIGGHQRNDAGHTATSAGGPIVVGKVAYCAQIPWIVANTVRENILFGSEYEADKYKAVLSACALDADIAGLPAGDQTELGERGINLSGGQKARVALARAAYADVNICLMDDPLSAVDPKVARTLFNKCIGPQGIMKGRTRILVTHQRQFLPLCDQVMVLRAGRVVALGAYEHVASLQLPELLAGSTLACETTVDEATENITSLPTQPHHGHVDGLQREAVLNGGTQQEAEGRANHTGLNASEDRQPHSSHTPTADMVGYINKASSQEAQGRTNLAVDQSSIQPISLQIGQGEAQEAIDTSGGNKRMQRSDSRMRKALSYMFARGPHSPAAVRPVTFQNGDVPLPGSMRRGFSWWNPQWQKDSDTSSGDVLKYATSKAGMDAVDDDAYNHPSNDSQQGGNARGRMKQVRHSINKALEACGFITSDHEYLRDQRNGKETADFEDKGQLVKEEGRVMGNVPLLVYWQYFMQIGPGISLLLVIAMFMGQAVFLASEWWLSLWSKAKPDKQGDITWLWVYALLIGLVCTLSAVRAALFFNSTVTAATRIHDAMVRCVLRSPLSFFHTNPAGRILNRFSKDLGQVDDLLPQTMFDALQVGFLVLSACVLVAIAVPFILPVFVPLVVAFIWLRARYLAASREVKRWEATTRSPVFAAFSATLKGLPTIRAYGAQGRFQRMFLGMLSANGAWYHAYLGTARWIGFRLDIISATTLLVAALLAMATRDSVQTSLLALALSHVLQLTGYMQWFVRQSAEVENIMTSMERMLEYTGLVSEPPLVEEGGPAPPPGWPATGALQYHNVTAVYRAGLPPVLSGITFNLKAGSSCGVVGRTGSGKSSLMLTLFRLIPVTHGKILLDGVDTSTMGLDALRKQLAIIPQDPVLFSGTIRSNLDPWSKHTVGWVTLRQQPCSVPKYVSRRLHTLPMLPQDDELWEVLTAAKLQPTIVSAGGLDARMAEAGDNLSAGQRQLFCLARALLQRAKVLALDEATANVDRGTDALIQGALRAFVKGSESSDNGGHVLLVIAHRIDTILDTDSLLVLQSGKLVEHGSPSVLANQQGGLFASMVSAARLATGQTSALPLPSS